MSDANARPQPFTFAREFKQGGARVVPLEEKEATLTQSAHHAALQQAVAGAHAQGVAEGRAAARAEETARLARAMEAVSTSLDQMRHRLDQLEECAAREAIRFAELFAGKLSAGLVAEAPVAMVERVAAEIFTDLRGQAHVAVRVAPELVEATRDRIGALARDRGFEGRLIVMGEPEISAGDVRIEWADGGIVRDQAAVASAIQLAVERVLASRHR
jgi:flagellar assembly protein FliH